MKRIGIEYYLEKVPGNVFKEKNDFDTLDEVIEHYRQFKISVRNYYLEDNDLKETHPKLYKRLTGGEVKETEIRKMTEHFYMENAGKLSNALNSNEYELD
jgi:hypothetical protein